MTAEPQPQHRGPISPHFFYLFFAVLVLGAGLALLEDPPNLLTFAFVCVAWVFSVVLHEFGHAFVGYRAGDTSVADKGYLTLDPFLYANWQLTIVLPLILLALGGIGFPGAAVYLREDLMRSRLGRSAASLAGPAATLIVLLLIEVVLRVMALSGWADKPLYAALAFLAFLQAMALVLNLLPVPGFDGYGVIRPFLPDSLRKSLKKAEGVAFLVVFLALMFLPQASELLFGAAAQLAQSLGIPLKDAQAGLDHFRFWKGLTG